MVNNFQKLFPRGKPIIGMIHLSGESRQEKIDRAVEELNLYAIHGVDGAIIEDYFGDEDDLFNALNATRDGTRSIVRGVNFLRHPYRGFEFAREFGCRFIQIDATPNNPAEVATYKRFKETAPEVLVLGGVRFKYQKPTGLSLEQEIASGVENCDAIVTTGDGTGVETPIGKLHDFKEFLNEYPAEYSPSKPRKLKCPLIVGAGVTVQNVAEQLSVADGAIVGSYFKVDGKAENPVDRRRVAELMNLVRKLR